ncbi:VOC family protein [Shewanella corallii]|uniref:VOC family protein n=1 Tax=Shewanella corallii TaxID=560080 RepID=A0ABT0NAP4_9GAMM|nr:VOC family protein [Shewanella corallii]MCL2915484.1 VOC family protein [Shewanella corallii]
MPESPRGSNAGVFSRIPELFQVAYVVPDIYSAIQRWNKIGVGPFYVFSHLKFRTMSFMGKTSNPDVSIALSYYGNIQLELIQQHDRAPSIYSDFIKWFPNGGQQHLGVISDNYESDLAYLENIGIKVVQQIEMPDGQKASYVNGDRAPDIMIEVIERTDNLTNLFEKIKNHCEQWDGHSGYIDVGVP